MTVASHIGRALWHRAGQKEYCDSFKIGQMFHHEIIESEGPIWGGGHERVDTVPSAGKHLRAGLPIGN